MGLGSSSYIVFANGATVPAQTLVTNWCCLQWSGKDMEFPVNKLEEHFNTLGAVWIVFDPQLFTLSFSVIGLSAYCSSSIVSEDQKESE